MDLSLSASSYGLFRRNPVTVLLKTPLRMSCSSATMSLVMSLHRSTVETGKTDAQLPMIEKGFSCLILSALLSGRRLSANDQHFDRPVQIHDQSIIQSLRDLDAPSKALRPWHSTRKPPQGHVVTRTKPRG